MKGSPKLEKGDEGVTNVKVARQRGRQTLQQMLTYAKFLKDILANQRKVAKRETLSLVHKKLPTKLKDLRVISPYPT
ncbi:hypothetical protein CR513_41657, partial [Mucuna pruriens]